MLAAINQRLKRLRAQFQEELDRRRALEASLDCSDRRHAELLGHFGLGFFRTGLDGALLQVNQGLATWAGFASPEEMVGTVKNARDLYFTPSERAQLLSRVIHRSGPISFEGQFRTKTGQKNSGRVTMHIVRDRDGSPLWLEGAVEDTAVLTRTLELADAQRALGDRLATASTLDQALRPCLETAIRLSGMDGGEVYILDAASGAPFLAECIGCTTGCAERVRQRLGSSEGRWMMVQEPLYAVGGEAQEAGRRSGCAREVLAHAIIPIPHEGVSLGWLVARSHYLGEVPDFSKAALETVAAQIGSAIARIQTQEALAASQRQLRALFDSLNDFLIITDLEGYILDANWSVVERLGWMQPGLRGRHLAEVYSADLRDRFDALRTPGKVNPVFETMLHSSTDIPVEIKLSPGTWDSQNVIISVGRDLSERRKSEAQGVALREKTALLKEIHHRVKNNLQIISSLLSLQSGRMKSAEERRPFRDSQARVQAMALLHEQLYQSQDLSRIDFSAYLRTLAAEVLRVSRCSKEIDLRLELEPVWLNSEIATPCGLIVNELITNSCKYAFPGDRGEIALNLTEDDEHNVTLQISDNGIGLPPGLDFRRATTLGLQLVDDMVSQLKGSWTAESCHGSRFRIVIPARVPVHGNGVAHGACPDSGR